MRLYEPKAEVRLIKAIKRKEIIPDVPVSERYGDIVAINLTKHLSDTGGIRTSKSVREPAGGFSVTIADQPIKSADKGVMDTLYGMIEPMDLIEIRFCHDPFEYAEENEGYRPPIVMRGLVSSVTRNEAMSGGKPQRQVTISGQDFGKILQIIQIFYLDNSVVGDNILSEFAFFRKYAGMSQAKEKPAKEFVEDVVNGVINTYLQRFSALADGKSIGAAVVNKWTPNVTIKGVVSPYAVASFNNVSLYQMLQSLLDVGPFNEMFVEDLEDGIQLTIRPLPYLDAKGSPIQEERASAYIIDDEDIVASSLTRTDGGVANYYWVGNSRWSMMNNETAKRLGMDGPPDSFILFDYLNSQFKYYGIRKMEVESSLGPEGYSNFEAQTKEEKPEQTKSLSSWLVERRKLLADINKDNAIFEFGTLRIRGNEHIKAGMQLYISRGADIVTTCYVVKVDHDYSPFQGFFSTLTVERGTSFIERSKAEESHYYPEMDTRGVQ